jgi:hypothetical protein
MPSLVGKIYAKFGWEIIMPSFLFVVDVNANENDSYSPAQLQMRI